jgi:1-acyl-sn-glycerol-3-phosphate acyltransferase
MVRYHFPIGLVAPRIPSILCGRHRSLTHDINTAFRAIGAAPRIVNPGFIPSQEPFVVVMNHFHRADIPSWWLAMAVIKAVADRRIGVVDSRLRMIVASQWTYDNPLRRLVAEPLSRFMIARLTRAYDFLAIEPIALGAARAAQRAHSMRRIIRAARAASRARDVILLAPEGGDTPAGALAQPPAGAGRFMLMLSASGLRFVPVGAFAEADRLITNFGEPFHLLTPPAVRKSAADVWAIEAVMARIASLLPPALRGTYQKHDEPVTQG